MTPAYQAGRTAALQHLRVKEAAGFLRRAGTTARNFLIGEKGALGNLKSQLASGQAFRRGGIYHNELNSKGKLLMQAGLPAAFGAMSIAAAPEGQKGEAAGQAIGNTVGGFLGMPLGMLGSMAAGSAGDAIGGAVGRAFSSPRAPMPPAALPATWQNQPRGWAQQGATWTPQSAPYPQRGPTNYTPG